MAEELLDRSDELLDLVTLSFFSGSVLLDLSDLLLLLCAFTVNAMSNMTVIILKRFMTQSFCEVLFPDTNQILCQKISVSFNKSVNEILMYCYIRL